MRNVTAIRREMLASPPLITIAGLVLSKILGIAIEELANKVKDEIVSTWTRGAKQEALFGRIKDCEFIVDELNEEAAKIGWQIAKEIPCEIEPKLKSVDSPLDPVYERDLCFIGTSEVNEGTAFVLDDIEKFEGFDKKPQLAYRFGFDFHPKCRRKSLSEVREIRKKMIEANEEPPLNYSIRNRDGKDVFIPHYNHRTHSYDADYLMIVKAQSSHEYGRAYGAKNMVFGGCHTLASSASPEVIRDAKIVDTLYDKVGNGDFQAIVAVKSEKGRLINDLVAVELIPPL